MCCRDALGWDGMGWVDSTWEVMDAGREGGGLVAMET